MKRCKTAVRLSGVDIADIAAIGIANQRETTLLWDKNTGECLHNAIGWQCRRTAPYVERLVAEGQAETIRQKTGLVPDAYFSGTKLAWLLDTLNVYERAGRGELCFGTVDSFLAWNLVDGRPHVTDATNASRTMLFNIHTQAWDDDLLHMLNIPKALLPEVVDNRTGHRQSPRGHFGKTHPRGIAGGATSTRRCSGRRALIRA